MKKILILVLVLVAVKGMSQNTTERKVKIGFQFTADFNNKPEYIGYGAGYYVTSTDDFNYTAGVVARFRVAKKFELGTGLLYSNKDMVGFVNCPNCDMI